MLEDTPNFYNLLGLNPDAAWDQSKFEQILKKMQNEWSRESMSMGMSAMTAKRNLELIPEIKAVMSDPAGRARQAQTAKSTRQDQQEHTQKRLVEFAQELRAAEQKGYLEDADISLLVANFKDVLSEAEILASINVPVHSHEENEVAVEIQPLIVSTFEEIQEKLTLIHMSSLYQLLKVPSTASKDEIDRAAEQLFDEMAQRQPKTVEVTVQTSLAGHAKNIFSTQEKRAYYDTYLSQQHVDTLLEELNTTVQRTPQHTLTAQEAQAFIDAVRGIGWSAGQANDELMRYARAHEWTIQGPESANKNIVSSQGDAIRELRIQNIGTALRLTWRWSANCNEVRITYSDKEWPQPDNGIGSILRITRAEYELGGHYDLRVPSNAYYYITVDAFYADRGIYAAAPEARIQGYLMPHIVIRYEIKNPRFGYKYRTLQLYLDAPSVVPTLLLVSRRNGLPMTKAEGEQLHREPGPIHLQRETIIQLPSTSFPTNTYARLFLEDDSLYSIVTIYLPDERKLKLG